MIPYELVSMAAIIRDFDSTVSYFDDEHEKLTDIADNFYNVGADPDRLLPEYRELYNQYGPDYFAKVTKDMSALDSQVYSPAKEDELSTDYYDRLGVYRAEQYATTGNGGRLPGDVNAATKITASTEWKETEKSLHYDDEDFIWTTYTKEVEGHEIKVETFYDEGRDQVEHWVCLDGKKLESFETVYDAKDFADYELYDLYIKPVGSSKVSASTDLSHDELLQTALDLINEYDREEFGDPDDPFDRKGYTTADNLSELGVMYTTDGGNNEVELQVYVDLVNNSMKYCVNGWNSEGLEVRKEDKYDSLEELIDNELTELNWDDLYGTCVDLTVPEDYDPESSPDYPNH